MEVGSFGASSEIEQLKRDRFVLLKEVMRLRNQEAQTSGELGQFCLRTPLAQRTACLQHASLQQQSRTQLCF